MNCRRFLRLILCTLCLLPPLLAGAQQGHSALYRAVDDFLRTQTRGLPGKVSFRVTPLDPRTQLAECEAFDTFFPTGSGPWGKTTIGVRCLGPSSWTIYVQAHVSVQANYLVAARPLSAGQTLGESDFLRRTGDLGTLPSSVLLDAGQAVGKTVKIGIAAGQPLRSDQLIEPWAIQLGQNVKTVTRGAGFSVSSEGKALNNATEGQVVQVRTPSGQIVSGIARAGGVVEITY
jgi:flagella basal body P-ring formation protein FlgA